MGTSSTIIPPPPAGFALEDAATIPPPPAGFTLEESGPPTPPGKAPLPIPRALQGAPTPVAPGYMGIPSTPSDYDWKAVVDGTVRNVRQFGSDTGRMIEGNPELGGSPVQMQPNGRLTPTPPPTSEDIQRFQRSAQRPLVPFSEGAQPGTLTHGLLAGGESLLSPQNISIALATWPLSTAARLAQVGYDAVAIRTLNAGLGAYFTKQMAQGAAQNIREAYDAYQKGDLDTVADKLGAATVQAILAGLGLYHAGSNLREIAKTPVPKLPENRTDVWSTGHGGNFQGRTPEVVSDLPPGENIPEPPPGFTEEAQSTSASAPEAAAPSQQQAQTSAARPLQGEAPLNTQLPETAETGKATENIPAPPAGFTEEAAPSDPLAWIRQNPDATIAQVQRQFKLGYGAAKRLIAQANAGTAQAGEPAAPQGVQAAAPETAIQPVQPSIASARFADSGGKVLAFAPHAGSDIEGDFVVIAAHPNGPGDDQGIRDLWQFKPADAGRWPTELRARLAEEGLSPEKVVAYTLVRPDYAHPENMQAVATHVAAPYRRQGVASALYNAAEQAQSERLGQSAKMQPSRVLTDDAKAFWEARQGATASPAVSNDTGLVQRFEVPGQARADFSKPQGIYTTPAGVESPHAADLGGDRFLWQKNPDANVLSFDQTQFRNDDVVIRPGAASASAGIWALRDLLGQDAFDQLRSMPLAELRARLAAQYPQTDWQRGHDKQDVLEALGGLVAREHGYDAIELKDHTDPRFSEYVGLTPRSMVPVESGENIQQDEEDERELAALEGSEPEPTEETNPPEDQENGEHSFEETQARPAVPESHQVAVDPARLDWGNNGGKEGDISASYSADKIGSAKAVASVRKPFTHDGKQWIAVGLGSNGVADAYQIVPVAEFAGTPALRKSGPGYHGLLVKYGQKQYVMVGPEVRFVAQPAETETPAAAEPKPEAKPESGTEAPPSAVPEPAQPSPEERESLFRSEYERLLSARRKEAGLDLDENAVKETITRLTLRPDEKHASAAVGERSGSVEKQTNKVGKGKRATTETVYHARYSSGEGMPRTFDFREPERAAYWLTDQLYQIGGRESHLNGNYYGGGKYSESLTRTGSLLSNQDRALAAAEAAANTLGRPELRQAIYMGAYYGGAYGAPLEETLAEVRRKHSTNLPGNESALTDRTANDKQAALMRSTTPNKGYSDWEHQLESYENTAKGLLRNLEAVRERFQTAREVNGGPHPEIEKREKTFNEIEANIQKNLAFVRERVKDELEKHRATLEPRVRAQAEGYARFGEAAIGEPDRRFNHTTPEQDRARYAKLSGIENTWPALLQHFGIKEQARPERVPIPTGKDKLLKEERMVLPTLDLLRDESAVLSPGARERFQKRGWADENGNLTELGKRAVYSLRMAEAEAAKGKPMAEYEPGKGVLPPPGESRFGNGSNFWNKVKGEIWHTDGHGAWKGEFPKNWPKRSEKHTGPNIEAVLPKEKGAPVKPIGFTESRTSPGDAELNRFIYFDNGAAMGGTLFDYTNKLFPGLKWTQTKKSEAFQAWKDGQRVAIVMPLRTDRVPVPENLASLVKEEAKPKEKAKPKTEDIERAQPWRQTRAEWEKERRQFSGAFGPGNPKITDIRQVKPKRAAGSQERVLLPDGSIWEYKGISAYAADNRGRVNGWENVTNDILRIGDHKEAIRKALQNGEPVPEEVLADYPDLRKELGETARVPELPGNRDESYILGSSTRYHIGRMRFQAFPVEDDEEVAPHTNAHLANLHTIEFLGRASARKLDDAGLNVGGFHFSGDDLPALLQSVEDQERAFHAAASEAIQQLKRAIRETQRDGKSLIFIKDHASVTAEQRQAFFEQELNHVRQRLLGPTARHLGDSAAPFVGSPRGQKAKERLERKQGYQFKNDYIAALEIGERLMRPGAYQELGVSGAERDVLAAEYVQSLEKEYGAKAQSVIHRVRESQNVVSGPETGGGSAATGSDSSGSASRNGAAATGRPDDGEGFGETAREQRSLFDAGSDQEVDHSVTLGSGLGALQPYLEKLVKSDIAPTAKQLAEVFGLLKHDLLKVFAPAAVDEFSQAASLSVRQRAAELQRSTDRAEAALRVAEKYFAAQSDADNFAFMDRVEKGEPQPRKELQGIADVMRQMLDSRREAIRALGKGKLEKFIENYFPHVWKKPQQAAEYYANVTKRPLEGAKSFLKKRSIDSIAAGLAAGLEPVSTNPAVLVRLKAREMDKYLAAQKILDDLKQQGLLAFVDAREGRAPIGWIKIDDPAATVYGPSIQHIAEYPNEGLWSSLEKVAQALGVKHERGFLNLRGAIGRAGRNSKIKTLHGTAEDVVAHEIGHQIDFLAGSGKRFVEEYPDKQTVERIKRARKALKDTKLSTPAERKFARQELKDLAAAIQKRKAFAKELRELADLRSGPTEYTHKREEKMAQLAEMWVGARELFQRTAPTVFQEWKQFLDANPKLHALRDIEGNTEVTQIAQPYDVGGLVIKGHWYAPEAAARILNNYLSPGLREKFAGVRAAMSLANVLNQAQLGFSGFHAVFTGLEAVTSKLALGIYQAAHGDVVKGLQSAALAPAAPFTSLFRGNQMKKEWFAPGTQGAFIGQLVDSMMIAGGRAHMDAFYRTHVAKRMVEAWREGNVLGALLRVPFAVFEVPTRLIMEELVPRLKMAAFADMAEYELSLLPPGATIEDADRAMAKAWDSIDNRFGQLVYDNLFWHKYVKDIALLTVRSPGWNVGDIRELAGGYGDTAKFAAGGARAAYRKLSGGGEGTGGGPRPEFTHRMAYIPAHLLVAATVGALLYYLWHGTAPKHLKDYFFPDDGHGKRWSPATYVKDEYNWQHDPARTAEGKINPLLRMLTELAENRDYRDKPIVNTHHHWPKELKELGEYIGQQFEPLWVEQMTQKHQHRTLQDKLLPEFGITRAPKSLDHHATR